MRNLGKAGAAGAKQGAGLAARPRRPECAPALPPRVQAAQGPPGCFLSLLATKGLWGQQVGKC